MAVASDQAYPKDRMSDRTGRIPGLNWMPHSLTFPNILQPARGGTPVEVASNAIITITDGFGSQDPGELSTAGREH